MIEERLGVFGLPFTTLIVVAIGVGIVAWAVGLMIDVLATPYWGSGRQDDCRDTDRGTARCCVCRGQVPKVQAGRRGKVNCLTGAPITEKPSRKARAFCFFSMFLRSFYRELYFPWPFLAARIACFCSSLRVRERTNSSSRSSSSPRLSSRPSSCPFCFSLYGPRRTPQTPRLTRLPRSW